MCIHTMKYYSALSDKEILEYITTCMKQYFAKWNKSVTKKKTNIVWFHIYEALKIVKIIEIKIIIVPIKLESGKKRVTV